MTTIFKITGMTLEPKVDQIYLKSVLRLARQTPISFLDGVCSYLV